MSIHIAPTDIRFLGKASESKSSGCPAAAIVPGGAIIQGKNLSADTLTALAAAAAPFDAALTTDESAVFIPDSVIDLLQR